MPSDVLAGSGGPQGRAPNRSRCRTLDGLPHRRRSSPATQRELPSRVGIRRDAVGGNLGHGVECGARTLQLRDGQGAIDGHYRRAWKAKSASYRHHLRPVGTAGAAAVHMGGLQRSFELIAADGSPRARRNGRASCFGDLCASNRVVSCVASGMYSPSGPRRARRRACA